jgi:hypothetical protein
MALQERKGNEWPYRNERAMNGLNRPCSNLKVLALADKPRPMNTECPHCKALDARRGADELYLAAVRGDLSSLENARRDPGWTNDARWQQILRRVVALGHMPIISFMIRNVAMGDPDWLVGHAASHGHLDVLILVRTLTGTKFSTRAMAQAAKMGQLPVMELLNHWRSDGLMSGLDSALIAAASTNQEPAAHLLRSWGAKLDIAIDRAQMVLEIMNGGAFNAYWGTIDLATLATLERWKEKIEREQQHAKMLRMLITLRPLALPTYPLLWLLEYAAPGPLAELDRVRLIERVLSA